VRIVHPYDDDDRIVMAHTVSQVLAGHPFYLVFGGSHLARLFISRLAAACTRYDYVAVDVVTGARDLVEHEASHEATVGVAGALVRAKVVQRLT
jgi:hypothetical protein